MKSKKSLYKYFAAFLCGILILAKIPWIAAAGSIFLILMYLKKYKDSLLFLIVPIVSIQLYMLYGLYYDADLFFNLMGLQTARYDLGFASIYALFQKPYLVDRFYLDGWIYFGWFSLVLLMLNIKKHYLIIFAALSYFVIFLAGIPDEPGHGWYRYPFYPFLIIGTAIFIKDYFAKKWVLTFLFLALVGVALFESAWKAKFGFSFAIFRIAILGWLLVLLPVVYNSTLSKKIGKIAAYSWLVIYILMNVRAILIYNEM